MNAVGALKDGLRASNDEERVWVVHWEGIIEKPMYSIKSFKAYKPMRDWGFIRIVDVYGMPFGRHVDLIFMSRNEENARRTIRRLFKLFNNGYEALDPHKVLKVLAELYVEEYGSVVSPGLRRSFGVSVKRDHSEVVEENGKIIFMGMWYEAHLLWS